MDLRDNEPAALSPKWVDGDHQPILHRKDENWRKTESETTPVCVLARLLLRELRSATNVDLAGHLLDIHEKFCDCQGERAEEMDVQTEDGTLNISDDGSLHHAGARCFSTPVRIPRLLNDSNSSLLVHDATPSRFMDSPLVLQACNSSPSTYIGIAEDNTRSASTATTEVEDSHSEHADTQDEDLLDGEDVYDPNISDARATLGDDIDHISDVEEDLLTMPLPETDNDGEVNLPDSSQPLLDLICAQRFIGFVEPILDLVKLSAGTTCTRPKYLEALQFPYKMYGSALVVKWMCARGHTCGSWASQPKIKKDVFW